MQNMEELMESVLSKKSRNIEIEREEVAECMDLAYNTAIDHAIEMVKSEYKTLKASGQEEKYYSVLNNISIKLRNLIKESK